MDRTNWVIIMFPRQMAMSTEYITFPDIPKDHIKLVVSNYIKLYTHVWFYSHHIPYIPLKYPHYIPLHSKTNPMEITIIFH